MNKKVRNATECTYKGVNLRSKLELMAYKEFEKCKLDFEYEKHKFTLIEKFECNVPIFAPVETGKKKGVFELSNPKIQSMSYTPDFVIHSPKGDYIVELKGQPNDVWPYKLKLFKRLINDGNYKAVFIVKNKVQLLETINYIKNEMSK